MPVALTSPGVYVEELPSGQHTITGVATSITAFVGRTLRGPSDQPLLVQSYGDFTRYYGGLSVDSTVSYAVQHFFQNGGTQALICRVVNTASATQFVLSATFTLTAANEGSWGDHLCFHIDYQTGTPPTNPNLFNLFVKDAGTGVIEMWRNLSIVSTDARYVVTVLQQQSMLVRAIVTGANVPPKNSDLKPGDDPFAAANCTTSTNAAAGVFKSGSDGVAITDEQVVGASALGAGTGLYLLNKAQIFNLLCIPPFTRDIGNDLLKTTWDAAVTYCAPRRAVVIVDGPSSWTSSSQAANELTSAAKITPADNAAIYFPRLLIADPNYQNQLQSFAPCGVVAGIYARTDAQRGVWKAPAGIDASLSGVSALTYDGINPALITDADNGLVNPLGGNCLRNFPVTGLVVWGARTLRGADMFADQWKYLPVRRLAFYIESSLYQGTQWVVFEPNDPALWAQIRMNIGDFMQTLFRQGAFQGTSQADAYFVKCDGETTTPTDIGNGIVNILVGFAPLNPAEFVVIQIQQMIAQAS